MALELLKKKHTIPASAIVPWPAKPRGIPGWKCPPQLVALECDVSGELEGAAAALGLPERPARQSQLSCNQGARRVRLLRPKTAKSDNGLCVSIANRSSIIPPIAITTCHSSA